MRLVFVTVRGRPATFDAEEFCGAYEEEGGVVVVLRHGSYLVVDGDLRGLVEKLEEG